MSGALPSSLVQTAAGNNTRPNNINGTAPSLRRAAPLSIALALVFPLLFELFV